MFIQMAFRCYFRCSLQATSVIVTDSVFVSALVGTIGARMQNPLNTVFPINGGPVLMCSVSVSTLLMARHTRLAGNLTEKEFPFSRQPYRKKIPMSSTSSPAGEFWFLSYDENMSLV
jgi:hypothetical protein